MDFSFRLNLHSVLMSYLPPVVSENFYLLPFGSKLSVSLVIKMILVLELEGSLSVQLT